MRRGGGVAVLVSVLALVASAFVAPVTATGAATRRGSSTPTYRQSIETALTDIQDYWTTQYRDLYGTRYIPVPQARIVAARPGVKIPRGQGQRLTYRDVSGNAAYCSGSNFVVYDDVGLMPDFYDRFGPFAVGLVFAHEWGHAIQDRADVPDDTATVHTELQADRFAGAWTADVADDPEDVTYEPADEVIPLTVDLLNDFYSQVEPAYRPITIDDVYSFDSSRVGTIPKCGGSRPSVKTVENRVYFCIDDEYIAFDEPFLQGVYDNVGDFGVATLLANPWATHVQLDQGIPGAADNTLEAVLQADCYTGGWVAAFCNGVLDAGSLSAGDLDGFVQAYLVYSRARGVAADVPITFVRVSFFRRGFLSGYQSCAYADVAEDVAAL